MADFVDLRDPRMVALLPARPRLERLATGARWSEGPLWIDEQRCVLWSDIPNDRVLCWSERNGMRVWAEGVEFTNGRARAADGSIIHCSHGLRALYRTSADSPSRSMVTSAWRGKRFNSPNDVVVRSDGTIWFTDPPYGLIVPEEGHGGTSEIGDCLVFRLDPEIGTIDAVTDVPEHPNGLAFSPDESRLYVSDTSSALPGHGANHCIHVFDMNSEGRIDGGRVFAEVTPGVPDGLKIDEGGCVYAACGDGVQVFDPDGTLLGKLLVPEKVSNLTFGGAEFDELYVTASTSLYRVRLAVRGAGPHHRAT